MAIFNSYVKLPEGIPFPIDFHSHQTHPGRSAAVVPRLGKRPCSEQPVAA